MDTPLYQKASEAFRKEYGLLLSAQGVEDLFLLTPAAELVFSLRPMNEELGVDLSAEGFYGKTLFSELIEAVLRQRRLVISNYGRVEQVEQATVLMGIPVFSTFPGLEQEIIGIMVRPFSLKRLRDLLESYSGLGNTGEVMLAQWRNGKGSEVTFINHFRNPLQREPDLACQQLRREQPLRFPMMHALDYQNGSGWVLDNSCREVFAIWSWMPQLKFAIVVKQDREEVLKPLYKLKRNILAASLLVLLFLVWMIHRQARILVRPILALTRATQKGMLEQYEGGSIEEIDDLAGTLTERTHHLERARRETDLILESMDEGLLVVNRKGVIERINRKLLHLLGGKAESWCGKAVENLFRQTGIGYEGRYQLQREEGEAIPVSVTQASLESESQAEASAGKVLVIHDLRPLIKAQEAESANKAKDDFLAVASHELRTPLTAIIGNSEMLLAETQTGLSRLGSKQRSMVQAVEMAGRMQLALVNDILDLSKIEAGKFEIDRAAFNLGHLLREIEYIFSYRAQSSGLHFRVEQTFELDYLLLGDVRRVSQILINLLSNAIKFTEQGEVSLILQRDPATQQLCFLVRDQGMGIAADAIENLFKPFEQADRSISGRYGGTGLGLHISRTLAHKMGGEIVVESTLGEGSQFELRIPYEPSDQPLPVETGSDEAEPAALYFQGRLLLAEDTPELQEVTGFILESMGLEVTLATNGQEAVDLALQQPYDLILMDMRMPLMDGVEATRRLRNAGYQGVIIAHSADVMKKHLDSFLQAGCDDLLPKPIEQSELRRILKQYLKPARQPAAVSQPKSSIDIALQAAEFEISPELQQIFLDRLVELKAEMAQACAGEQWDPLHDAAHAIKGSGTLYGFPLLTDHAKALCDALDEHQYAEIEALHQQLQQQIEGVLER